MNGTNDTAVAKLIEKRKKLDSMSNTFLANHLKLQAAELNGQKDYVTELMRRVLRITDGTNDVGGAVRDVGVALARMNDACKAMDEVAELAAAVVAGMDIPTKSQDSEGAMTLAQLNEHVEDLGPLSQVLVFSAPMGALRIVYRLDAAYELTTSAEMGDLEYLGQCTTLDAHHVIKDRPSIAIEVEGIAGTHVMTMMRKRTAASSLLTHKSITGSFANPNPDNLPKPKRNHHRPKYRTTSTK